MNELFATQMAEAIQREQRRRQEQREQQAARRPPNASSSMTCAVAGCAIPVVANGMCSNHYQKARRCAPGTDLTKDRRYKWCNIEGCTERSIGSGRCDAHWPENFPKPRRRNMLPRRDDE